MSADFCGLEPELLAAGVVVGIWSPFEEVSEWRLFCICDFSSSGLSRSLLAVATIPSLTEFFDGIGPIWLREVGLPPPNDLNVHNLSEGVRVVRSANIVFQPIALGLMIRFWHFY